MEPSWKIIMNLFFAWPVYYNKNADFLPFFVGPSSPFSLEIRERPFVGSRARNFPVFISPYYTEEGRALFSYTRHNARGDRTTRVAQFPDRINR